MSRSRKKVSCRKDGSRLTRRMFWKAYRSRCKNVIKKIMAGDDYAMFPKKEEVVDAWTICDYSYIPAWSFEEAKAQDLAEINKVRNGEGNWYWNHEFSNRVTYYKYLRK